MFASSAAPCRAPDWDWDFGCCDPANKPLVGQTMMSPEAGVAAGRLGGFMLMPPDATTVGPNVARDVATLRYNDNRNLTGVSGVSPSVNTPCVAVPAMNADGSLIQQRKRQRDDDGGRRSGLLNSICSRTGRGAAAGTGHQQMSCPREGFLAAFLRQQMLDVDALVTAHAEKVRAEALDSRRRLVARLTAAADTAVARRVRQKQEEISRIGQANAVLEDRLRCLAAETMAWRDIATANEVSAAALRYDLETALFRLQQHQQQLARVSMVPKEEEGVRNGCIDVEGIGADVDAQESCCGDNQEFGDGQHDNDQAGSGSRAEDSRLHRRCRDCGEDQAVAVLLPCRHLCLCSPCASRTQACPLCSCAKRCTLLINLTLPSSPSSPSNPS